jgi:hypothetical protein
VKLATGEGWRWLVRLNNHLGVIGTVIVLSGAGFFSYQFGNWWLSAFVVAAIYIAMLTEGAFRVSGMSGTFDENASLTPVVGRSYRNERVSLDGFSYAECTFTNVTLVFEGRAPFHLAANEFNGAPRLDFSSSPAAQIGAYLYEELSKSITDEPRD